MPVREQFLPVADQARGDYPEDVAEQVELAVVRLNQDDVSGILGGENSQTGSMGQIETEKMYFDPLQHLSGDRFTHGLQIQLRILFWHGGGRMSDQLGQLRHPAVPGVRTRMHRQDSRPRRFALHGLSPLSPVARILETQNGLHCDCRWIAGKIPPHSRHSI
jgi:hypothetical protein